ncbi:MAG: hypothetical protein NT069_18520 [Planctomycetota bacterium]|nr:hypothetical protein [Planctomycetota bacterium]
MKTRIRRGVWRVFLAAGVIGSLSLFVVVLRDGESSPRDVLQWVGAIAFAAAALPVFGIGPAAGAWIWLRLFPESILGNDELFGRGSFPRDKQTEPHQDLSGRVRCR